MATTDKNYLKIISFALIFISIVLFVFILKILESFLILFVIAIFLTFMLDPVVLFLEKHKVPRWLAIIIILVVVFLLIYSFGLLLITSFGQLPQKVPQYLTEVQNVSSSLRATIDSFTQKLGENLGVDPGGFDISKNLGNFIDSGMIGQSLISITNFIGNVVFIMIFWLLMISGKPKFEKKIIHISGKKKANLEKEMHETVNKIQSFMFYKTLLGLSNGILMTIIYAAFGLEFAIVWGFLMFIMDYVPNLGPIVALAPPFLVALAQFGLSFHAISLISITAVIQIAKGNYIEPKIFGTRMNLSPVFILFSIFFWGYVWGITGAFLAVPIAYVIKIIFEYSELLRPYSILLGNEFKK